MDTTNIPDRYTVIAIAIIAYASGNISHEILGHCGTVALLGSKCTWISTTYIPNGIEYPSWKFRIVSSAGSVANWMVALVCIGLQRTWRNPSPALRYFLWLSCCVNLFIPSTYLLTSPIISFGDWYNIIYDLPQLFAWRVALTVAGAVACWLSFRVARAELAKLVGSGWGSARSTVWALIAPAYIAGGVATVAAALFSPLPAKWAQLQAVGATFGFTFWLFLLPVRIPEAPPSGPPAFRLSRSVGWIVAGTLCALAFISFLGPGFPL
jgi:hypothetical protein